METLLRNLDRIHTTEMGAERIKRNLKPDTDDVIAFCKEKIADKSCIITKEGKNYYCGIDNIIITVNSSSFTIITAHSKKHS